MSTALWREKGGVAQHILLLRKHFFFCCFMMISDLVIRIVWGLHLRDLAREVSSGYRLLASRGPKQSWAGGQRPQDSMETEPLCWRWRCPTQSTQNPVLLSVQTLASASCGPHCSGVGLREAWSGHKEPRGSHGRWSGSLSGSGRSRLWPPGKQLLRGRMQRQTLEQSYIRNK